MPTINNILVYSPADLGGLVSLSTGTTFTVESAPNLVQVTDPDSQDTLFQDGVPGDVNVDPEQFISSGGVIDGQDFTGLNINPEIQFEITGSNGQTLQIFTLTTTNGGQAIGYTTSVPLEIGVTYTVNSITSGTPAFPYADFVLCFSVGTEIQTPSGEIAVENLNEGDLVITMDNGSQAVLWVGRKKVGRSELRVNPKLRPIRIKAGALGSGLPVKDLLVSPQHRVLICSTISERMYDTDSVLVPANKLLSIDGVEPANDLSEVEYFHILFDDHQIIFSNGAPTESLYLGAHALSAMSSEAFNEIAMLFPEILEPNFEPKPARFLPQTGKKMKNLLARHKKNAVPLLQ